MALVIMACGGGDDAKPQPPKPKAPVAAAAAPAPAPQPPAGGGVDGGAPLDADGGLPALPLKEFQEGDFVETDRSRDPFRSFEHLFLNQAKGHVSVQRQVLIDRYALEELKLVGIVTRAPARVLLIDPSGLGWVGKVGDFLAKPELVHSGGPTGSDVAINWRIDRIRDADIVLVREDPSHPEIPPTTRVMALYPVEDGTNGGSQRNR